MTTRNGKRACRWGAILYLVLLSVPLTVRAEGPSDPPSPGGGEYREPIEQQAARKNHETNDRGRHPGPQERDERTDNDANPTRKEAAGKWWRPDGLTAGWATAFLTGGLLLVASIQAIMFVAQLRSLSKSVAIARVDAEAARISADAIVALERPWLVVESVGDPGWIADAPNLPSVPPEEPATYILKLKVTNLGRGPAWITSEGVECLWVPQPAPDSRAYPDLDEVRKFARTALAPGKRHLASELVVIQPEQRELMLRNEGVLMLYGLIRYRDAHGRDHDTGFCFLKGRAASFTKWDPENGWSAPTSWDDSTWWELDGPETYTRRT